MFSNEAKLLSKGLIGQFFYWMRYVLCALPLCSTFFCIYWAIISGSKDFTNISGYAMLSLNIIEIILSACSFVIILFAVLSILSNMEKLLTYIYGAITMIAFIIGFILLAYGSESKSLTYLSNFNALCGAPNDSQLVFPTPGPTPQPTPQITDEISTSDSLSFTDTPNTQVNNANLLEESISEQFSHDFTESYSDNPETTPPQTEASFCSKYWTTWSRKRYIRARTNDSYHAFSGILSPWIISFFIEMVLIYFITPHQKKPPMQDHANVLIHEEEHSLQGETQMNGNDNDINNGIDPIFRDEVRSSEEESISDDLP
ncbi:hypothetical protein TRFO_34470 [Tritrichomonas foetus]|uniref:Uncharacterized protein n=1 Tax=Tritrichomonas foetus TaxID=1144522 RepID=A0A1J4JJ32_9EUKA|nr:hypothetical protein TRFO_34470 [Tritrichomonas foetus]|eukprot:OHS99154.1 hypothetical protein TRFO_34470 [Tritrichomonas foetus]